VAATDSIHLQSSKPYPQQIRCVSVIRAIVAVLVDGRALPIEFNSNSVQAEFLL
jgi:hypothetical protein